MRFSRSQLLPDSPATVHMYWRCHNRSYLLQGDTAKAEYLKSLDSGRTVQNPDGFPPAPPRVQIHAFGIMDNHIHLSLSYEHLEDLSGFMQRAHGRFGARMNKRLNRTGPVGNERPRTSLVQNERHAMRAHFYVEANPVRAGVCKPENLHRYKWSSYRFYAYGIVDEQTKILTPPDWYKTLGATAKERQARYRSLFMSYLRETEGDRPTESKVMKRYFIGDADWFVSRMRSVQGSHGRDSNNGGRGQAPPPSRYW
jgi:REP element-mobilizing transposase RayT